MNTSKVRNKFTEMSKIFKDIVDEYESLKSENEDLKEQLETLIYENYVIQEQVNVLKDNKTSRNLILDLYDGGNNIPNNYRGLATQL